jgi:predicted dehydrogenase
MRTPLTLAVAASPQAAWELKHAFGDLPDAEVRWISDSELQSSVGVRDRRTGATVRFEHVVEDESVDAVVLALPIAVGAEFARQALAADKHVLLRGPIARASDEAEQLLSLALARDRCLMPLYPSLFDPAVQALKAELDAGRIGDVYYGHAARHDPGRPEGGDGVIWRLGAETVALVLDLLGDRPIEVSGSAESYLAADEPDVVFCELRFATGIVFNLRLSCLDLEATRSITVVGSRFTATYDELRSPERRLMLYQRLPAAAGTEEELRFRCGDIVTPRVADTDPLRAACRQFVAQVRASRPAIVGPDGAAVVEVLEALERSIQRSGTAQAMGTRHDRPLRVLTGGHGRA